VVAFFVPTEEPRSTVPCPSSLKSVDLQGSVIFAGIQSTFSALSGRWVLFFACLFSVEANSFSCRFFQIACTFPLSTLQCDFFFDGPRLLDALFCPPKKWTLFSLLLYVPMKTPLLLSNMIYLFYSEEIHNFRRSQTCVFVFLSISKIVGGPSPFSGHALSNRAESLTSRA